MADIEKYISIVKKELSKYMSTIFEKDYDKNIFEELFRVYVDTRYYNLDEKIKKKEELRKVVLIELEKEKKNLLKKYDKTKVIDMCESFTYIIYFDSVGNYKKIENIVNKIIEFREEKLNKKDNKAFSKNFLKLIQENNNIKQEYIKKFDTQYFKLRNKKIEKSNLILTTLRYNIEFPKAFTSTIIEETYNSEVINEDKLFVEYNMVNAMLLRDIIKGEFCKEYLVEFTTTVLNKKTKLSRILKILNNENLKERVNLLIEYKEFNESNKKEIYSLMRQGYKIAVRLNEKDKLHEQQINRLNVFSYILINDKATYYKELTNVKEIAKKVVKV